MALNYIKVQSSIDPSVQLSSISSRKDTIDPQFPLLVVKGRQVTIDPMFPLPVVKGDNIDVDGSFGGDSNNRDASLLKGPPYRP